MSDHSHDHAHHDHVHDEDKKHPFSGLWDKLGIFASALCLIDCIVLPIASTILLSINSTSSWAAGMHTYILPIIGVTAGMAFYHSVKAHRAIAIAITGGLGFLVLVAGEIYEARVAIKGINWITLAGSSLLIGAHLRNLWMHRSHKH